MCLYLPENWKKETEKFRNSSKILTGYKILKKIDDKNFESIYQDFPYKLNEIAKSNRKSTDLSEKEITYSRINFGLHFFKNLNDTKIESRNSEAICFCCLHVICKFEILPENLVALGIFRNKESFVATEAKFVEVIEEI